MGQTAGIQFHALTLWKMRRERLCQVDGSARALETARLCRASVPGLPKIHCVNNSHVNKWVSNILYSLLKARLCLKDFPKSFPYKYLFLKKEAGGDPSQRPGRGRDASQKLADDPQATLWWRIIRSFHQMCLEPGFILFGKSHLGNPFLARTEQNSCDSANVTLY